MEKHILKRHSILIASLIAVATVGCGGESVEPGPPASGVVTFSGSATVSGASTTSTNVPASGGSTVATDNAGTGGSAVIPSGAVPAGTTVPAGTNLAIIPSGTGFPGSFSSGSSLTVNGVTDSGIGVSTSGQTTTNMALPVATGPAGTFYTLTFPAGDLQTIPAPSIAKQPRVLTIQQTVFTGRFYIIISGGTPKVISPVPGTIAGVIPNNGQNAVGSNVLSTYGPGNNGRKATLTINYGTGFQLKQTRVIANNQARFLDLTFDKQTVPATGVALVQFDVGDL